MEQPILSYGRQKLDAEDIRAVVEVLRGERLTQGPMVPTFERAVAARSNVHGGVAFNSATSALHAACLALDLGPGDRLWTSPITFVASANVGAWCGAEVDFIDVDPLTGNMSVADLAFQLEIASGRGRLPKVVMPVHFAGQPCDMDAIGRLAERYRFRVIEDASHALGAMDHGVPIGACRHSDITVFSFHPVKMITTAEGGMALAQDPLLLARMRRIASHGIDRERAPSPSEPWRYDQIELGLNYRMTELQAALGLSQLQKLDEFVAQRQALAQRYRQELKPLPVTPLHERPNRTSSWHLYVVLFHDAATRLRAYQALHAAGIQVQVHYVPVPTQPYWRERGARPDWCRGALDYASRCLSLPLHCAMDERDQDRVIAALAEVLQDAPKLSLGAG